MNKEGFTKNKIKTVLFCSSWQMKGCKALSGWQLSYTTTTKETEESNNMFCCFFLVAEVTFWRSCLFVGLDESTTALKQQTKLLSIPRLVKAVCNGFVVQICWGQWRVRDSTSHTTFDHLPSTGATSLLKGLLLWFRAAALKELKESLEKSKRTENYTVGVLLLKERTGHLVRLLFTRRLLQLFFLDDEDDILQCAVRSYISVWSTTSLF